MSPGKRCITATIAVVLLSLPCLGNAASMLAEANAQTRNLVRQVMEKERIPGLQVVVVKDDEVVLSEGYGLANVENRAPVTRTTLFPINSATKTFTGVAMMQLAEAGLVDLGAPISRYLDDLPETWQDVRVRQLLAHTSGLPNIVDRHGLLGGGTELDAWKAVKDLPMDAPIGERFAYNQTNYGLLARIIAKQAQMPFEQHFTEHQFAVAGMHASTFGDSYDLVANAATVYSYARRRMLIDGDDNRLTHWIDDLPPGLRTGAGIQTTADELASWIIALTKGRLLSPASVRDMWTPEKLNNGTNGNWAAGWPVLGTSPDRAVAGIGGGRSAFVVYPDDRLAIIVLSNLVGASPEGFIPRIAEFYESLPSDRSN